MIKIPSDGVPDIGNLISTRHPNWQPESLWSSFFAPCVSFKNAFMTRGPGPGTSWALPKSIEVTHNDFELLHFCGHGDFKANNVTLEVNHSFESFWIKGLYQRLRLVHIWREIVKEFQDSLPGKIEVPPIIHRDELAQCYETPKTFPKLDTSPKPIIPNPKKCLSAREVARHFFDWTRSPAPETQFVWPFAENDRDSFIEFLEELDTINLASMLYYQTYTDSTRSPSLIDQIRGIFHVKRDNEVTLPIKRQCGWSALSARKFAPPPLAPLRI